MQPPLIVVIGGSLAGMAAAARLAKLRHPVVLLEHSDRLGGRYAARPVEDAPDGTDADDLAGVLSFPAPWRDLFHKTGRSLEDELARRGLALVPAPPARHRFADGAELVLASDRGEQHDRIGAAFGRAAAQRWQDLLDRLDEVWQVVRRLGLEEELVDRRQIAAAHLERRLGTARTMDQLARSLDEPHLAALVRSVARQLGSTPAHTPAWCAVQLSVERHFGRWRIVRSPSSEPVRAGELVETLTARLALRRVDVRTGTRADGLTSARDTGLVVSTSAGPLPAAAVVAAVDPWTLRTLTRSLPGARAYATGLRRLRPAAAPLITHTYRADPYGEDPDGQGPGEDVRHTETGPVVTWTRPAGTGRVVTVHDWTAARPDPSAGVAWRGPRSWLRRPAIRTPTPRLYTAGPHSRGGPLPYAQVLSGALAAYACHIDLTGVDPNPFAPGN